MNVINIEDAIAKLNKIKKQNEKNNFILCADEDAIIKFLKSLDSIDIVHCQDCENFSYAGYLDKYFCDITASPCNENDFCSYGVRK